SSTSLHLASPRPFPTRRSSDLQCAFFFKIKSVFGHLLPSGLQIAFFIKVICLTVDILPAGYFLQRSGSIRLKIADSLFCLLPARSEEHTSELQSRFDLVCRLLL